MSLNDCSAHHVDTSEGDTCKEYREEDQPQVQVPHIEHGHLVEEIDRWRAEEIDRIWGP